MLVSKDPEAGLEENTLKISQLASVTIWPPIVGKKSPVKTVPTASFSLKATATSLNVDPFISMLSFWISIFNADINSVDDVS